MTLLRRIRSSFAGEETETQTRPSFERPSVGDVLRTRRLALDIDINEAAAALKIKAAYLAAIEEGRPDQLPGATYAVGFVRSYSELVGLDSTALLRQFKLECAGLSAKPDLAFPMPLREGSLPTGRVLILAIIFASCGYGAWYHWRASEREASDRVTEVPAELLPAKLEPRGPPDPISAIAANPLPAGLGPDGAYVIGPDKAGPAAPGTVPARRSGDTLEPHPLGSGPNTADATSGLAPPSPAKLIPAAPPPAKGPGAAALLGSARPAPAAGEAAPTAPGQPNAPQAPEPLLAATATTQTAPVADLSGPANLPMTGASAAAPPEGARDPAEGLSGLRPQSNDSARADGVPAQQSRVTLRAIADSWIQIRAANHSVLFTGVLKPGDIYRVPDLPGLTMRAGNAGGLDVTVDGRPASPLGPVGAVRNVSLSPQSLAGQSAAH
jgi:cytoskeletal protein RodZ